MDYTTDPSPRLWIKSYWSTHKNHKKSNLYFRAGNLKRDIIPISEVKRFIVDCFVASNTPKEHAELMADLLVDADYRGHFSHGMNRLEMYLNDLQCGTMDGHAVPKILKETPATAWVDGNNGLGAVNGKFCMELAIKKAKNVGVGWVSCKHSNHYGIYLHPFHTHFVSHSLPEKLLMIFKTKTITTSYLNVNINTKSFVCVNGLCQKYPNMHKLVC